MNEIIAFQQLIMHLKKIKRTGWLKRNIKNPESVSDHIFSVSVLAMQMSDKLKLNTEKCMRIALLHEIAETKTGDLIPSNPRYREKQKLEREAIKQIVNETGNDFFLPYLREYEENRTKEAKLVHDCDKIEMCLQALEYEKTNKRLDEFFDYVNGKLHLDESIKLFNKIKKIR